MKTAPQMAGHSAERVPQKFSVAEDVVERERERQGESERESGGEGRTAIAEKGRQTGCIGHVARPRG